MELFKRRWEFDLYIEMDNGDKYLVWSRPGHYFNREYKWYRFIELTSAFNDWLNHILEDIGAGENVSLRSGEFIKDGMINPHYRWSNEYKNDVWLEVDKIKAVYYDVSNVLINPIKIRSKLTRYGGNISDEYREQIKETRMKKMYG